MTKRRDEKTGWAPRGASTTASPASRKIADVNFESLEREYPRGLTAAQIVDLFNARGEALTEATFRKYIQLGLLPRSVRVGQKGKHRGSQGFYPAMVLRRLLMIRELMQSGKTIEEIREMPIMRGIDVNAVSQQLRQLIAYFERSFEDLQSAVSIPNVFRSQVEDVKGQAEQLIAHLRELENRLVALSRMRYAAV